MTNRRAVLIARDALVGENLERVAPVGIEITDGKIASISSELSRPSGAAVLDAGDVTLIPGFIDAHVHIAFARPADVVERGVTTVRDLGWPIDEAFAIARESLSDSFHGPTVHAVGPIITCPGGYPTRAGWAPEGTGHPVMSVDHAKEAVVAVIERGAPQVKIALETAAGPVLGDAELHAVVDTAHGLGKRVTSHTRGIDQLERALDMGVDELAHMLFTTEPIDDQWIDRMVTTGMAVVPTLSSFHGRDRRAGIESLRRFFAAGGTVVYGTDLGNAGPRPGIDKHEVTAMADAGMTARDILESATVTPRRLLGFDSVGALIQGADADIVGLARDPTAPTTTARDLTDVRFVMRRGVQYL
ncbi:MAG: amidohydrolase family protein [Actinomycetota bacterium]|nr:amidohydrolase family protein [Actinomycetota bacterium]